MMIQFLNVAKEAMVKAEKQGIGMKRRDTLPLLHVGLETMPTKGTSQLSVQISRPVMPHITTMPFLFT